jgi:hypothetical protein
VTVVLGLAGLFSGVALLVHILAGYSLRLALAASTGVMVLAVSAAWRRATPAARTRFARIARVGVAAGLLATVAYDATRFVLSRLDPSPYNPYEVLRIFGQLLVGRAASPAMIITAGIAFHALNGIAFGTSYCALFGTRGVRAGIAWGLFLEVFQLTLYPGWLDIRFYREFATISALSHVAYGAVLGFTCRAALRGPLASAGPGA